MWALSCFLHVIPHSYYVFIPGPLREMCISRLRLDLPRWYANRSSSGMHLSNFISGVLTPGKGNRLILANTEELHHQIDQLRSRNRELENALQLMQENVSDQPHPLLRKDILRIPTSHHDSSSAGPSTSSSSKSPAASLDPPAPTESILEEDHHTIDANGPLYSWNLLSVLSKMSIGTLVIGQRGESSYLGRTARAEVCLFSFVLISITQLSRTVLNSCMFKVGSAFNHTFWHHSN